jgi:hypothetical protein
MRTVGILFLATCIGISSCELLEETGLTTEEVVDGLKTALIVGTDSSSTQLSISDGYYRDQAVKILLPPEADIIVDNLDNPILSTLGLDVAVENVVKSINRAAEDAASESAPIFKDAITSLSISDAWSILKGTNPANVKKSSGEFDSTAATQYLISTTYQPLYDNFSPKINASLGKNLGLGFSATQAWNTLTSNYNSVANTLVGQLAGLTPVNTSLGGYCTEKALDGLFLKVGEQERSIRQNPLKWATTAVGNILEKVFGN